MFCKSRSVASDWDFAIMGANWSSLGYGGGRDTTACFGLLGAEFLFKKYKEDGRN